MGLEIAIMREGNVKYNKRGQAHWRVTRVAFIEGAHELCSLLMLENCKTISISGGQIWEAANEIAGEIERENVQADLGAGNVKNDFDTYYQVEASW